ncbi:hypothetical protein DFH09DRAFT_951852, partial [Mycena vulgaris]
MAPKPPRKAPRQIPVLPKGDPELDKMCENAMASRQSPAEMLRSLYGKVYAQTAYTHVYIHGSCKRTGTGEAQAVVGVFWGETSATNCVLTVPGPEPPTNNRAAIYAALTTVREADPHVSLMIFTNSEYTIRHACYWAGKNSQIGWSCPNGDLLKDLVFLLSERRAPTRFTRVERGSTNLRAQAARRLA